MGNTKFCGNKTIAGFSGFVLVSFAVLAASHAVLFNDPLHSLDLLRGCFAVAVIGGIAELVSGVCSCAFPRGRFQSRAVVHPHFVFL